MLIILEKKIDFIETEAKNNNQQPKQYLPDSVKVSNIFNSDVIKTCPSFKFNVEYYMYFASKGYYFQNCRNKESYYDQPKSVNKKYYN